MTASIKAKLAPRPRRGSPDETRERLVRAAAEEFNRDGFEGTDSNRIARAAGYAPGTFYKHFEDKTQIFLAVYEDWVAHEWKDISTTLREPVDAEARARNVVTVFLSHHRKWCGFRRSLRGLVAVDPKIRLFFRAQRRAQLETLAELRSHDGTVASREEDALLLFTLERAADALADGEAEALKLKSTELQKLLVDLIRVRLQLSNAAHVPANPPKSLVYAPRSRR